MMNKFKIALAFVLIVAVISCRKEGPGGKSTVKGVIYYNGVAVPQAAVYIKYGATESPGDDISLYDTYTTTDGQGNYIFSSLVQGNYYIYSSGLDQVSNFNVKGGRAINLKKKQTAQWDVWVTQ
jgi:hypothetical protein